MTDVTEPTAAPLDEYIAAYERAIGIAEGALFVQGDVLQQAQAEGAPIRELIEAVERKTGQSRRTVFNRLKVAKIFRGEMRHFDWSTHLLMTRGCKVDDPATWEVAYQRLDELATGRLTLADLRSSMKRKDVRELNVLFRGRDATVLQVCDGIVTLEMDTAGLERVQPGCTIAVSLYQIVAPCELEDAA